MTSAPTIRTPDQKLRVFISSTLQEAADERAAAGEAVRSLHMNPVMFELGARPHPPRDLYRSYLAQSHIFVGIYWERYGWIAPGETISGLEDEYLLASDLPKLIYVKRSENREPKLEALLDRIRDDDQAAYKPFTDAAELRRLVQEDLALILAERFELGSSKGEESGGRLQDLPMQPTPFLGREREGLQLRRLLARDEIRLVTLTGPGGMGKSRLAFEVASGLRESYRDGVYHVLLSSIVDPLVVAAKIAHSLGVPESSERSDLEGIKEFLRDKHALLLIDNFEHLLPAAPVLSEILTYCPDMVIVVTSRAALRLRDEHEFMVPALPCPAPDLPAEKLSRNEAVRLFVDRAKSANPQFAPSEADLRSIAEICIALDGMPLAIELAAARSRLLTPQAMHERITKRLTLLTGGPRDLPARQRTLRATLDWDYEMLDAKEQEVFRRLAVFTGGFTLNAAADIVDVGSEDVVMEMVDSLVGKSLVMHWHREAPEPRFAMLKTIREYAFSKLDEAGETPEAKARHAHYFTNLAELSVPEFRAADQVRWVQIIESEHDNMRSALRWAAEVNDKDLELRLAAALAHFWEFHAHLSEGQRWLESALSGIHEIPDALRADALDGAGNLARGQGEFKRAVSLFEEALTLRRRIGDQTALAVTLKNLGNLYTERGDHDQARGFYEECLDIRKQLGDERGVAEPLNNLGVLARIEGDWSRADTLYEEALELFRRFGDTQGIARALMNLGDVKVELGDVDGAARLIKESIALCVEMASTWDLADLFEELAYVAEKKSRSDEAARFYGAGEKIRDTLGAPLPPAEQEIYGRRLEETHQSLGANAFKLARDEGYTMELDAVVERALEL